MLKESIHQLNLHDADDQDNDFNPLLESPRENPKLDIFKKQIEKSSTIYEIKDNDDLDDMNFEMDSYRIQMGRSKLLNKIKMYESIAGNEYKLKISLRNQFYNSFHLEMPKSIVYIG